MKFITKLKIFHHDAYRELQTHHLLARLYSPSKLVHHYKYQWHRVANYANWLYRSHHLRKPTLVLVKSNTTQMTSTYTPILPFSHRTLIVLNTEDVYYLSFDSLKFMLCHELGHYYAPHIVRKHHLVPVPITENNLIVRLILGLFCSCLILGFFLMIRFPHNLFITTGYLMSSIGTFWWIPFVVQNNKAHIKQNWKYNQMLEYVADEFAVTVLHSASLVANAFYSIHLADTTPDGSDFDSYQTFREKNLPQIATVLRTKFAKSLKNEYVSENKVHALDEHDFIHLASYVHPSTKKRITNCIRFYKSGMEKW